MKDVKNKIREILGEIGFEGHFDKCFENLKETQQEELVSWLISCKEHKENVLLSKKDKTLIGFTKKFGSNLRAILIKEKNGYFIVLFLDKHKYYETEMEKRGFF